MAKTYCYECDSFDSGVRYDYSGGPGVAVCDCGTKGRIVDVPQNVSQEKLRMLAERASSCRIFNQLMTQYMDGQFEEDEFSGRLNELEHKNSNNPET